jgi:hypothetical protein
MVTRFFWLKSDGKTIQEIDSAKSQKIWRRSHVVYVHSNGDFYTNRSYLSAAQFRQILDLCIGVL